MKRSDIKPSDWAWIALALGIVLYELAAPPGELMSEGWDRYLEKYPVIGRVLPLLLTLHVINALPNEIDPVHQGLEFVKAALRGTIDH